MVKMAKAAGTTNNLMNNDEWEDFWDLLEARRRVVPHQQMPRESNFPVSRPTAQIMGPSDSRLGRPQANKTHLRCGACKGCTSSDCGLCKNCRDKPRFGGPGIKKKACLRRICHKASRSGDHDSDEETHLDDGSEPATSPAHLATPSMAPPHVLLPHQVQQGNPQGSALPPESAQGRVASAATSPDNRPSSPHCTPEDGTGGSDRMDSAQATGVCEPRSPLEDTSNLPHEPSSPSLDVLSRLASQAVHAR